MPMSGATFLLAPSPCEHFNQCIEMFTTASLFLAAVQATTTPNSLNCTRQGEISIIRCGCGKERDGATKENAKERKMEKEAGAR